MKTAVLILCAVVAASTAHAATDNFGRVYRMGVGLVGSADAVGVRAYQVRPAMAGAWAEVKSGSEWNTVNVGATFYLAPQVTLFAGAGISILTGAGDMDTGLNIAAGGIWSISRHLDIHAGYDTRPGGASVGAGYRF